MGRFSYEYMLAKDIDWFFNSNGVSFHVASAGSILPEFINNTEILRELQHKIYNLPENESVTIVYNEEFLTQFASSLEELNDEEIRNTTFFSIEEMIDNYLDSFRAMARKGFVSLDKTNINDPFDSHFHWVCRPEIPLKVENIEIPTTDIRTDINFHYCPLKMDGVKN